MSNSNEHPSKKLMISILLYHHCVLHQSNTLDFIPGIYNRIYRIMHIKSLVFTYTSWYATFLVKFYNIVLVEMLKEKQWHLLAQGSWDTFAALLLLPATHSLIPFRFWCFLLPFSFLPTTLSFHDLGLAFCF